MCEFYSNLDHLNRLIDNKKSFLTSYVKKENANDHYIKKSNEELELLVSLYNELEYRSLLLDFAIVLDETIRNLYKADPETGKVNAVVHLRNNKSNSAYAELEFYEKL